MRSSLKSSLKSRWVLPVGLFLLALGVRLVYLSQIKSSPFFSIPLVDAKTYVDQASQIAGGDWLGDKPFWQPPLYPYFLGVLYALFGERYGVFRAVQFVLGASSCVLIYLIGKRLFNSTVALVAGSMACFYGVFIYFEGELLPPAIAVFLDLAFVLMLLWTREAPGVKRGLCSGVVLGLSAITVPNVLLFLPVASVWLWLGRRRAGYDRRKLLACTLGLWVGTFSMIAAVSVRNYVVGGDRMLISANAGVNFYIGNNPDYDRTVRIRPGPEWDDLLMLPVSEGVERPSERSRFFLSKSWTFMRERPGAYVRLLFRKLGLFWHGNEIKRNSDIYFARQYSWLLSALLWKRGVALPFGVVAPLGLIGILVCLRRWREMFLPLGFVLSYMVSVILFFVCARYRAPVIPFLLLFASYAICWGVGRIRSGQYTHPALALLGGAVLCGALNLRVGAMDSVRDPEVHFNLGYAYRQKGMYARATEEYRRTVQLDPRHIKARSDLASMYALRGMFEKAILEYKRALELEPGSVELTYNLASAYLSQGRYREAIKQYEKAMDLGYRGATGHLSLGYAYMQEGMTDEALRKYLRAIQADSSLVDAHLYLAVLRQQEGRYEDAIIEYERVLQLKPAHVDARIGLAISYGAMGMLDIGVAHLERAAEIAPGNVNVWYNLGVAYRLEEMYDEAIEAQTKVAEIDPQHSEAYRELARLYREIGRRDLAKEAAKKSRAYALGRELAGTFSGQAERLLTEEHRGAGSR